MYFPFIRARQFELIALREYAECKGDKNNIVPIIEPVKITFNSMKLALAMLSKHSVPYALVLNPKVGDIARDKSRSLSERSTFIIDSLKDVLEGCIPTYIVDNDYTEILEDIKVKNFHKTMLICSDSTDASSPEFEKLVNDGNVEYIVSKENRTLKRKFGTKILIRLDTVFKPEKRNKDYLVKKEEMFTEEHLYFKGDGYGGFSDYTVISSDFKEGGALPYAVAIHLTFTKADGVIWMRHFTSVSNDDQSNIQGKFAEALAKLVAFADENGLSNNAIDTYRDLNDNMKFPGLGTVKKLSIKNHLELLNSIL
jgi:hypothetical protein